MLIRDLTTPAGYPQRTTLRGRLVSVVPLDAEAHTAALYAAASGHTELWLYLFDEPPAEEAAFRQRLLAQSQATDALFYSILDNRTQQAVGIASYLRIEPRHRVIEVGNLLFTPLLQRTAGATEAMYLMAKYVFEGLSYRRYEWKCNALNVPSRRAAERLGFTFEGVFRQHMMVKGQNRDTAWFSMLDSEWPPLKAAFEQWLDPANFDPQGQQRRSLADIRSAPR